MRQNVKDFVSLVNTTLNLQSPVYEFGSLQVPGQLGFADLRPLFPGKLYVGCDMRDGPGVDLRLNLNNIDLPNETAGSVICVDTLEHVEYPRKAVSEIWRILKDPGIAVIISVMQFPIHDHPHDYWRFTPAGFKSLLDPFHTCHVAQQGDPLFPHTVAGVGIKGSGHNLRIFHHECKKWETQKPPRRGIVARIKRVMR